MSAGELFIMVTHLSDSQKKRLIKWGEQHKNKPIVIPDDFFNRTRVQMIGFKHQFTKDFPIRFKQEGWKIIDFNDRGKYKSEYFFQINVDKPSNIKEDGTPKDPAYEYIKSTGKPYLVCELSAFRQNSYQGPKDDWLYTLGWFNFLRQGYFPNTNSPEDRWKQIQKRQKIQISDWRHSDGGYALICLQKVNDSTLTPMHETHGKYRHWLVQVINQIRNIYPKLKILIRPHLRTKEGNYKQIAGLVEGVELSKTWEDRTYFEGGEGLQKDLDGAKFVVSYNSNVLTQAVLQGIPSVCYDIRSMAAPVCLRPDQMNNLKYVNSFNRQAWLNDLAYTQWTNKEIRLGTAWEHYKKIGF